MVVHKYTSNSGLDARAAVTARPNKYGINWAILYTLYGFLPLERPRSTNGASRVKLSTVTQANKTLLQCREVQNYLHLASPFLGTDA